MKNILIIITITILAYGCVSVRSYKEYYADVEYHLLSEDFDVAIQIVEESRETFYKDRDRVLYFLDLGLLNHYKGEFALSNEYLTKAEYAIEELFTKSISRAATSLLINDTMLEYRGEDYEDIYINIFKALNYLNLNDFDAAFVEIRRIDNKLNVLSDRYNQLAQGYNKADESKVKIQPEPLKFHNSALGRYLSMLIYRAEGKMDAVEIDRRLIGDAFTTQANVYDFSKPRLASSGESSSGAKLNIIGFVGRAPDKKANTLYIHTESNLVLIANTQVKPRGRQDVSVVNVFPWPGIRSGFHFKFQLPYMEKRSSEIVHARVFVNDRYMTSLDKLESIENIAVDMFETRKSIIYTKTILRSITKGLLSAAGKRELTKKIDNPIAKFLVRTAVDLAVGATEQADLRISRMFPAMALVGEIDLIPGTYDIRVEYYSRSGRMITSDEFKNFEVRQNGLNLINSFSLR